MQQSCNNGTHILWRDSLRLTQVTSSVAELMLGGVVHGDGDRDAGNVGKPVVGVLMEMSLENVVHDELQATTTKDLLVLPTNGLRSDHIYINNEMRVLANAPKKYSDGKIIKFKLRKTRVGVVYCVHHM